MAASAKLLTTFKAAQGTLYYITLWLTDERQPLDYDIRTLSTEGRSGIRKIMNRRLDSPTRGILEISTSGNVHFLHRTARDLILQPRIWTGISSQVPEDFDPYIQLLRAETLEIPGLEFQPRDHAPRSHFEICLWYASQVRQSPTADDELILILDKLDQTFKFYYQSLRRPFGTKTFLDLMAVFCIIPYLSTSTQNNANGKSTNMCMSLLEHAVFGFEFLEYHIEWRQRIATVTFLLENEVYRKAILSNGESVIQKVLAWKIASYGAKKDYFTRVQELLSSEQSLKQALDLGPSARRANNSELNSSFSNLAVRVYFQKGKSFLRSTFLSKKTAKTNNIHESSSCSNTN